MIEANNFEEREEVCVQWMLSALVELPKTNESRLSASSLFSGQASRPGRSYLIFLPLLLSQIGAKLVTACRRRRRAAPVLALTTK